MTQAENVRRFVWSGQPKSEWPRWLIARNHANDDEKVVIHTLLEGILVARIGDAIVISPEQVVSIEKADQPPSRGSQPWAQAETAST